MNARVVWQTSRSLVGAFGWTGVALRARFEIRKRLGLFSASTRLRHDVDASLPDNWAFRVDLDAIARTTDIDEAIGRADRVVDGEHHAYRSEWRPLPRVHDEWNRHPQTGFEYPRAPWFQMHRIATRLDARQGDVKDVWEAARFGWVFDLIRGYAVTRDRRYVAAFWKYFEGFVAAAPPFNGVQWSCGQETAIRAIACLWAEGVFAVDDRSTAEQRRSLQRFLLASGERIANALEYGVSQRNNHGISEAAGLVALGARFAAAHRTARRWRSRGRRWLEYCVRTQFLSDGWYSQHSFTYLRVALDMLAVAEYVLRATGCRLSSQARARIANAVRLMLAVLDDETGDVPNHGANDGAFVLPITTRHYRDFRPAITAASAVFGVAVPLSFAIDPEPLAWLSLPAPRKEGTRPALTVGPSGWVSVRSARVRLFARAGHYITNPSHIDPLHVDLAIDGISHAIDAGTYRYSAPPPWNHGLSAIDVHNTVSLPSLPAAQKAGRFLWLTRPAGRIADATQHGDRIQLTLVNDSWGDHGVRHQRTIIVSDGEVAVRDVVESDQTGVEAALHWLIAESVPDPVVECSRPATSSVVVASEVDIRGWHSPEYATRKPARSLRMTLQLSPGAPAEFLSRFILD